MPREAVEQAVTEITKPRTAMHYARANQEIHALLRDRVEVSVRQPDGTTLPERLTVIDWENPENNDFLLVSQLWVHSDLYHRRADLVGFVNGIPLVFIELKASHRNLKHAYDDNLRDYRDAIPHLFTPNGFIVLSNGAETKVGTITSGWEFFSEWKKINSEGEEGVGLAGDGDPGHVHEGAPARPDRELRRVPGPARRVRQAARPQPPVPRRQQRARPDGGAAARPAGGARQARRVLAHAGLRQDACRCCSSRRRCCARCPATGRS